jgi:hypothetical protein
VCVVGAPVAAEAPAAVESVGAALAPPASVEVGVVSPAVVTPAVVSAAVVAAADEPP